MPDERRFYPYRISFDIECMLAKEYLLADMPCVAIGSRYKLLSITFCSVFGHQQLECFLVSLTAVECVDRLVG